MFTSFDDDYKIFLSVPDIVNFWRLTLSKIEDRFTPDHLLRLIFAHLD